MQTSGTWDEFGGKVAANRQCLEGILCGARRRLYKGLLKGRCGWRMGRNVERAVL